MNRASNAPAVSDSALNADNSPLGGIGTSLRRWLGEPLLQFLLIGTAIFAAAGIVGDANDASAHTIVVDSGGARRLADLYRVQMGFAPSRADLEHLIDSHIRDEVLYREAMEMGLQRDDEIIRRRLIQKMEFLQNDLAAVPEPTEDALRAYHAKHSSQFVSAGTATFTHVYFSADSAGEEGARRAAQRQLGDLVGDLAANEGGIHESLGDPFPLQKSYTQVTAQDAAQVFGRTPFIDALFSAPQRQWSGPVRSGYGWHLIFVDERMPPRQIEFAEARERVREAFIAEQARMANDRSYATLRSRYKILRDTNESGQ
jgi:hypothetical protein